MKTRTLFSLLLPLGAFAQTPPAADRQAIHAMCGCYEVKFDFTETFSPDSAYKFHKPEQSGALEWIVADEHGPTISLQHLLVVDDSTIVKHWRDDWTYEDTTLYAFRRPELWTYSSIPEEKAKGTWTQKVYHVDDSPRYEGYATWVHADGRTYWEDEADAPLPRREYTIRNDYNVLHRRNRHEITPWGWMHEQDNAKVMRTDTSDKILAYEKGLNPYRRVDATRCRQAQEWWAVNRGYWMDVRSVWDEFFALKKDLDLEKYVDGKPLYQSLFELNKKQVAAKASSEENRKAIRKVIRRYVKSAERAG